MGNKVKILISCHKPTDVMHTEVFEPIHVGAAVKGECLPGMLSDADGDNISLKNPMYCEMTAQYWAWKNLDADYYGFCHYRRYFNFSEKQYKEDPYGNIICSYLDKRAVKKYKMSDKVIRGLTDQYDVIITRRKDIRRLPEKPSTPREHYKKAEKLHIEDFERMLRIIDDKFPEYSAAAHTFADGHISCFCNMYILRKDLFFRYCEWAFAVLDEFCARTDMTHYSTEAVRTPGHLAERLFNIFLIRLEEEESDLRIHEVQSVLIEKTDPQESSLLPAFTENSIPVVFAANNYFVPVFSACLLSLMENADPKYNYDVLLITSDITKENKTALLEMKEAFPNVSLRFYDPGRIVSNYKLKGNAHISVETYYRFLIQDILKGYEKVLYLDCDIIIRDDVAKLYQTDVSDYMLGAVRDVDFLGQINGANEETAKYCTEKFVMKDPYQYFQAGVLLLNVKKMKEAHSLHEWLTFASHPYKYNDQDVLNLYCEGKVKYLDMSWNMITDCDHYRINHVIVFAPDAVQKEYFAARKDPKIIHYAGYMKPWYRPTEDFGHEFWTVLRRTPFYEEMLFRMSEGISSWQIRETLGKTTQNVNPVGNNESLHLRIINTVMPYGTGRRKMLDSMYSRLFQ